MTQNNSSLTQTLQMSLPEKTSRQVQEALEKSSLDMKDFLVYCMGIGVLLINQQALDSGVKLTLTYSDGHTRDITLPSK